MKSDLLLEDDVYTNDIFRVACKQIVLTKIYNDQFQLFGPIFQSKAGNNEEQYKHLLYNYIEVSNNFYQQMGETTFIDNTTISVKANPKLVIKNWTLNRFEIDKEPYECAIINCKYIEIIIKEMKKFALLKLKQKIN